MSLFKREFPRLWQHLPPEEQETIEMIEKNTQNELLTSIREIARLDTCIWKMSVCFDTDQPRKTFTLYPGLKEVWHWWWDFFKNAYWRIKK